MNKTHTHTHQTLRERQHWKELVSMRISDTLPFLEYPLPILPTQPLPFYGKNLNLPFFSKIFKNSSPHLYKG